MLKTTVNNEKKFIERADNFIERADNLNLQYYKSTNKSLNVRYRISITLYSILNQLYDMFYYKISKEERIKINKIKNRINTFDKNKKQNNKGIANINNKFFTYISYYYKVLNKTLLNITTTYGEEAEDDRKW